MSLLISLLILVVVFGIVMWIVSLVPFPSPWGRVVQAIVGLIFLIVLLQNTGLLARL